MNQHYNHILLIKINDIIALVWQGKRFSLPFSLQSMSIHHIRQTLILVIISIFLWLDTTITFSLLGTQYWCFGLAKKLFSPPFSLKSKFMREMRRTWIFVTISILFVIGATIMFSSLWYTILMLWICKESFSFHHSHIIKVHLWNKTNLDTHNNRHSFCYWHIIMFSTLGYTILMLCICKKIFSFHQFSYN